MVGTLKFCSECFESRKKVFTQLFKFSYYVEVSHFGFFFFELEEANSASLPTAPVHKYGDSLWGFVGC